MPKTSDLQPFLGQRPAVLIVEDRISKEYLINAWGADEQYFNILTVGSCHTVDGVVADLRKHGGTTVFGLADRDFGKSNVSKWLDANTHVLRPSFHELENVLLDWSALAGCEINQLRRNPRKAQFIEQQAQRKASEQPWWLACRQLLHEHQEIMCKDYPKTPPISRISILQQAFDHVAKSPWRTHLSTRASDILNDGNLEQALKSAHAGYMASLQDGSWVKSFSGKEIFRDLLSRIHDTTNTASSEADVDLAKSVGKWHYENGKVPDEIDRIRISIKTRVGI